MIKQSEIINRLKAGEEIVCIFYPKTMQYKIGNDIISKKQYEKLYSILQISRSDFGGITKHYYKLINENSITNL